jgi:lipopolysaccharide transport system permease protein
MKNSLSPIKFFISAWMHRQLVIALIRRDVSSRYKGAFLGFFWPFLSPLLMLCVYTFFLSFVLKAKWFAGTGSKVEFAIILFAGLICYNFFAECIVKATTSLAQHPNYIKKIVFPLEMLALVNLGSAFIHMIVTYVVWICFYCFFFGAPSVTILLMPFILLPFLLITLGLSWFFMSLGVYVKDVAQIIAILVAAIEYLSPIFYPLEALPREVQTVMHFSPLTHVVTWSRDLMIWDKAVSITAWCLYFVSSLCVFSFGYIWFQKTRAGFSDVI